MFHVKHRNRGFLFLCVEWYLGVRGGGALALHVFVEPCRDDVEDALLLPVYAAVSSALEEVALGRDALFLQSLEDEVRLARGNDGIGRAMHEERRSTRLADVGDRVGRFRQVRMGEHATIDTAEDRRAIDPESLGGTGRGMALLVLLAVVAADFIRLFPLILSLRFKSIYLYRMPMEGGESMLRRTRKRKCFKNCF